MAKKFSELVFYPNAKKKNPPEESSGTLDLQNGMPSTVKEEKNSDQMEITHRSGRKEKVKVHMTGSDYHIVKNKDGAQYTVDKKGNVLHGHGNANEEVKLEEDHLTDYRRYTQAAKNAKAKGDHDIAKDAEEKAAKSASNYTRLTGKKPTFNEEGKAGLWANIHAKRARIKAGSGEKMRKPGSEGAPTKAALKAAQNEGYSNYDNNRTGFAKRKREDDEYHVPDPVDNKPHAVHINGKKWKSFGSQSHAQNVANKIKGATVHKEEVVNELSSELLGRYKTAAGASAKAADASGNYAKGDKRFKGINKATNKQFDNDMKKEQVEIDEATVKTQKYEGGKVMTVHHGASHSYPLHPEHQKAIRNLKHGEKTSFRDETGTKVNVHRDVQDVHFTSNKTSTTTTVPHSYFSEEVELDEATPTSMQVKQGIGIARDKRYAGGNMTGAVKAMDKVNKGLAQHPAVKKELQKQNEDVDKGEYDYEGQMARTQLQTTMRNCEDLIDMIEDDENMPEWVQSKITLAQDYITTVRDYLQSKQELGEEKTTGATKLVHTRTGADGAKYHIMQDSPTDYSVHREHKGKTTHIDTYGSLHRAKSVLDNEVKESVELTESHAELSKHISDFSKGVKSSAAKQSTYKRDGKPIHNMKHVETDSDHQKVFDHLKKMGYKKTGGYDSKPNEFTMHHNRDEMTAKSDPVHHSSGVSAHVEKEHGGKTKVHFTHRNIKEQAPVAPVPDRKYIKGTPENKAYKATKKPINGHPTNVKEDKKEETMLTFASFVEALKGNQHKIDKNKNGEVDAHDFKLLRKEETEQIDEARVNGREYASQGVMHPDHAKMDIHQPANREVDFYASKTGDKMQGKVLKNDGKEVHIKANKELGDGKLHKFKVTANLPKNTNEEVEIEENAFDYKSKKSEVSSGRYEIKRVDGRTIVTRKYNPDTGMSTGTDDNTPAEKRGRGRPAGSKNRGSAT